MRFQGLAFRALNPVWIIDPLSGEGARRFGGRFNPKGVAALHTALDPMTAVREVSQIGQPLQPTMLITYAVDVAPVFDAADSALLRGRGLTMDDLAATDWRLRMKDGIAPSQGFAMTLIADGYAALRVPSFARGAGLQSMNLILWQWGPALPVRVAVVDDEGRLSRD
jgi:RES domain-containing protein